MELVLNTFGASLNRDNEGFVITHKDGKQRLPVVGIKSIQISCGAQITSDAVMLAIENEIEILFMDKSGKLVGRVWSPKYGSISTIRKGQLNFTFTKQALVWIKEIISKKIENQQAMLLMMRTDDVEIDKARTKSISKLEDYREKITRLDGDIVSDVASQLRGWEGVSSKIYFETLNHFIPEEYRFASRSQHPAMDVVNALLNYGYGLLYGKIEGALIKAGIDPYVGIFHRDDYNRPVLVYDVIEVYRIWVDYVVYSLVNQKVITDDYYSVREDGSYWLEGLGRRILIQSFNDYMEEVITQRGVSRSRITQIQLYAQSLAQMFKKYE
ncbi:MAG: CRISPR-associated endonuclease Cas1 [Bacteroidaceae bacterium]|nr:CRISPR-associated endonuclease Cas1 [Bacteroidaceae bacterium]